ncbi:MAG: isochorismatase family protein [Firmicutes bacterium]|jgi:nicotinamidase-related amidase|nr:isochorismatase family protein [Bacillota bacterium]
MRIKKDEVIGLVIDVQGKLLPHMYEADKVEEGIVKLAKGLAYLDIPVVVSEQYRKGLGETVESVSSVVVDYNPLEKKSFSCLDERILNDAIFSKNKKYVIISGIETHICVMQTAIDMIEAGLIPVIVEDAVSSRKENDKNIAIERLRSEGAIITTIESILFELTRFSGSEVFKNISKLIK